jgi:VanZ family protein
VPAACPPPLRYRGLWLVIGHGLLATLVVLSLIPSAPSAPVPLGDKLGHLLAYAALMAWYGQLVSGLRARVSVALGLAAVGLLLELLQGLGGTRQMEAADAVANLLGIALGWLMVGTPVGRMIAWLDRRLDRGPA